MICFQLWLVNERLRFYLLAKKYCLVCCVNFRTLIKAAVVVIPLLGITWVFGLLAINESSAVFAWIFTILNSLQVQYIIKYVHANRILI